MKFTIRRTSEWDDKIIPCKEAYKIKINKIDRWVVQIKDFGALIKLYKKYGRIIIQDDLFENIPSIEIYDDYRE